MPLLAVVTAAAALQAFYYYEAIVVLHLTPLRPYALSALGSIFLVTWPIWASTHGQVRAAYLWSLLSCIIGIGMCTYGLSP